MNLYVYVENNPGNWLDPFGLELKWMGTDKQTAILKRHRRRLEIISPTAAKVIKMLDEDYETVVEIRLNTGGVTRYDDWADPKRIDYNDQYCLGYDPHSSDPPWKNIPSEIALVHELIHALHDLEGVPCLHWWECVAPTLFTGPDQRIIGLEKWPEEYKDLTFTQITENKIRAEYADSPYFPGLLQREKY
ncbi:MAG: hypothetical protein GY797_29410 [Deltaproteobacteria bacterium]|nr:hypothetical protein [Deltaproteobacteria bacterium]